MSTPCSICKKQDIVSINRALVRAGTRDTARHFSLSVSALDRHKRHLPSQLVVTEEARTVSNANDLLAYAQHLMEEAERLGKKAEAEGAIRVALCAIGEQRNVLRLFGEILGKLKGTKEEEPTILIVDI